MAFDCTQVLDDDFEELCNINERIVVGCLVIDEKKYSIFSGVNIIGRDVATCDIALDINVLSKQHATIEVKNKESHLIYDMGSSNKTRLEKMVLEPQVRYNLENGANLYFGNVHGQYLKTNDHQDSPKETLVIGEKKMENLQLAIMRGGLNKPSVCSSQLEIDSANSGSTVAVQETNSDGDDNIFDLETQCEQDSSVDGDDSIFDMQTQEFGDNTYKSPCKLLIANENMKDRSLFEDDSDIFDNFVLEESRGEIPCTVEGKVEQKHLLREVVQESDDSGDETDPENIFMAETQKFHTISLNFNLSRKQRESDLTKCNTNKKLEDFSEVQGHIQNPAHIPNTGNIEEEITSNSKSVSTDDSDCNNITNSEGYSYNSKLCDISNHSTHELPNNTLHNNVTESRNEESLPYKVTHNKMQKKLDGESEHESESSSIKANKNHNDVQSDSNNVNKTTHHKFHFATDITEHELSTRPVSTQNVVSQEGMSTINIAVDTMNAQTLIANDTVILSEVVRQDISGSCDVTNDLMDVPNQIMMCTEMVGKVINKHALDVSHEGNSIDDTFHTRTESVGVESTIFRVTDQDATTKHDKYSNDEDVVSTPTQDVANTPTQIADIMHAPTEFVKNEIADGKIVHQDVSVGVAVTCDATDALTQIVTDDVKTGKVVHQNPSAVLAESDDDVQNAPTQVVNDEIIVDIGIHHANNCGNINVYGNSIYIASMSTQVEDVEIAVDGVSHQGTSVMNNIISAPTQIHNDETAGVNYEITVGKVIHQESSADFVKYGCSEEVIVPTETVGRNNDDVMDAPTQVVNNIIEIQNPPLQIASNKLTVEKVIHHDALAVCRDEMAEPTQISSVAATVKSGINNDIINAATQVVVTDDVTVNRIDQDMFGRCDLTDDIMNAPTQIVTDEVTVTRNHQSIVGKCCETEDIVNAPTQIVEGRPIGNKINHQDMSGSCDVTDLINAPTQIVTDEFTVNAKDYQDMLGRCDVIDNIMSPRTQMVDDEVTANKVNHKDVSDKCDLTDNIKTEPTQGVDDKVTANKVDHKDVSGKGDVTDAIMNEPTQMLDDEVTAKKVDHKDLPSRCDVTDAIMNAPTQMLDDELTANNVGYEDVCGRCDVNDDIMNAPTQMLDDEVTAKKVDHKDLSSRCDVTDAIMNAPTQMLDDEVTANNVGYEDVCGRCDVNDDIMNVPTQIMIGEVTDNKVDHQGTSGKCDVANDIMNAPTQMVDDKVTANKVDHKDVSGKGDVTIMNEPTQMLDDEVTAKKVDHKDLSSRCDVTDALMNAPTQMFDDEVAANNVGYEDVYGRCDVNDDIMNAPTQIMIGEVTDNKVDHQGMSGKCDVVNDIMNAPTQVVKAEVSFNEVDHQNIYGRCDVNDIMNAPTQIMIDDITDNKVDHQDMSGSCVVIDDIMNAPTQVVKVEVTFNEVNHQNVSGRYDVNDDDMNAPTQIMTGELVVNTGELFHQDNDITNLHSSPTHIKSDRVTVGSMIHQDTSIKLDKYRSTEDNFDVPTQITNGEILIPSTKIMEDGVNGIVVHTNNSFKCELTDDIIDASTQILNDEVIVGGVSYQNESCVPNDRIVIDDLLNKQKQVLNKVPNISEIIQENKPVVHKHSSMSAPSHVSHGAIIGEVVHQDNPVAFSKYDEMDILTQVVNEKQPVQVVNDRVSSGGTVDVTVETSCENRSVGSIIHQNTANLFDKCDVEDVMDAPTQIKHEERFMESKACQQNTAVVLSQCNVSNQIVVQHNNDNNDNNDCNNSAPEVIMSPVLCNTKHLRSYQSKQTELLDDAKSVETSRIKTEGGVRIEVSTLQENIKHSHPSSSFLKSSISKQSKDKDDVPEVSLRKSLRTYSSKQNATKKEDVVQSKSSVKKCEVSFASCPKKKQNFLDISESIVNKKSNKRGISLEETETLSRKKVCGGIETKSCSVQLVWPGKHQPYPGKKEFHIMKNSIEVDTHNNVGELLMPENKHENVTNDCETFPLQHSFVSVEVSKKQHGTGKAVSNRKRKSSNTPEDHKHMSPVRKVVQSQDIHITAELTCTRPKRNRKMTWKMLESEKTSPTTVKTVTRNLVEKTQGDMPSVNSLPTKASSRQNVVHDSIDNNKNSLARGSKCQSMLKDNSPVRQQRGNRSCKRSSENLSGEGVNGETSRIKNSSSSSNGNNSTSPRIAGKIKIDENLPLSRNCNSDRLSTSRTFVSSVDNVDIKSGDSFPSFTLEEIGKKIQTKGSVSTRSSRKGLLEQANRKDECIKSSAIKTYCTSKTNFDNEKVQVNKTKKLCSSKDFNSRSSDILDVKKDVSVKQLKFNTKMSAEGAVENKVRESRSKNSQNYLQINSKVAELNIIDGNSINESTEKILQENTVKTRNSLNKTTILIADICTEIPEVHNSNISKRTNNRSTIFKETLSKHKRTIESDTNSSNKKENNVANERLSKKSLQTEANESQSPSETDTSEKDNVNTMLNSQRNGRMTGSYSRKQINKSSLPKRISSSVSEDTKKNVTDKTNEVGLQLTPTRTHPKRLTNVGKGQNSPKKNIVPAVKTQVMFTGLNGEQLKTQETIVERLGGCIVDQPGTEMVLVAQKLCRTIKMLCAIARGIPIVNCSWLANCNKKGQFIGTDPYILQDKEGEKKFQMSLHKTLQAATQHPLLTDYSVMVTPHVVPVPKDMKVLVESCGGAFLSRSPRNWPVKVFVISCEEDKSQWQKLKKVGVPVVGPEVILSGVLRHEVDLTTHLLDHC